MALVINTGYLYLLFFGFQEIQSLEQDAVPASRVIIVSWIKKGYTMDKARYLGVAMILTVLITAAINIFYGLAVDAGPSQPDGPAPGPDTRSLPRQHVPRSGAGAARSG